MSISCLEHPFGEYGDASLIHSKGAGKIKTRNSLANEQWELEHPREANMLSGTRSTEKHRHERQEGLAAETPTGSFLGSFIKFSFSQGACEWSSMSRTLRKLG